MFRRSTGSKSDTTHSIPLVFPPHVDVLISHSAYIRRRIREFLQRMTELRQHELPRTTLCCVPLIQTARSKHDAHTRPHGAPLFGSCCLLAQICARYIMVLTQLSWLIPAGFCCFLSGFTPSIADGAGTVEFGNGRSIDAAAIDPFSVSAVDLDGDGDLDVIATLFFPDLVHWYENLDGKGTFSDAVVLSPCCDRDGPRYGRSDWWFDLRFASSFSFRRTEGRCCLDWSFLSTPFLYTSNVLLLHWCSLSSNSRAMLVLVTTMPKNILE